MCVTQQNGFVKKLSIIVLVKLRPQFYHAQNFQLYIFTISDRRKNSNSRCEEVLLLICSWVASTPGHPGIDCLRMRQIFRIFLSITHRILLQFLSRPSLHPKLNLTMRQQHLRDFAKYILTIYHQWHQRGNSYHIAKFTSSRASLLWPSNKSEGMESLTKFIGYVLTLVQQLCAIYLRRK